VWISERKDILSTLFGLLALLAYARHGEIQKQNAPGRLRCSPSYFLALFFFALSLMSKPMLVTLPFVLLLLDFWPLRRIQNAHWEIKPWGGLVLEKIPFFLLAAGSSLITFVAQQQGGAMRLMAGLSWGARVENAAVSYVRYLGKMFWPEHLAVIYPVVDLWPLGVVVAAFALLLVLSGTTLVGRRTHPYLVTGWFWFLGTLVPVIGLVAVGEQAMADRYTYFPMIGVLILATWGTVEMTRRWRLQRPGLAALSTAIILICILVTRQNISHWKTSESLFRHAMAVTRDNYSAHCNLGNTLMAQGRLEEALATFEKAAKLQPDYPENHCNVGVALANLNRLDEAIIAFQIAARVAPDYGPAYHNLGMAFERKGLLTEATQAYQEAIRLMPGSAAAHNSLGVVMAKQDRLNDALIEFTEAIRLDPSFVPAQGNLKMALELRGK